MSSERRFEQELPGLLDDLYVGAMPPYRDQILQQAARTRQRPAWSFLERWLPMVDIARQPVFLPRLPWRRIGLGLVLLALLVAIIGALAVGARPKLPAPFGPAGNGLVAYASGGDIYTVDPVTGSSTAIVKGPETDLNPRWSRDGTRLAFERQAAGGASLVFVARPDGSGLIRVTPNPLSALENYTFSPDGKELLITASISGVPRVLIAATDGSQTRQLDLPGPATNAAWRPPDGSEILFMDNGDNSSGFGGMYAVDTAGGTIRTILKVEPGKNRGHPMWSPDGLHVAYVEWLDSGTGHTAQTHIIGADGTADRTLPMPPRAVWQAAESWSNDGTRLLVIRGYTSGFEASRPVAIPIAGSGFGIEIQNPGVVNAACCSVWEWAPDDASILGTPTDGSGAFLYQVLLDPVAGTSRTLPWKTISQPSWQRLGR